ncbi:hypothetical protein NFJ02_11g08010 [Pycnococcus provasolii]
MENLVARRLSDLLTRSLRCSYLFSSPFRRKSVSSPIGANHVIHRCQRRRGLQACRSGGTPTARKRAHRTSENSVSLTFTTSAIEAALEDALDETDDDEYDNLTSCIPGYQQHRDVLSSALQARIERIVVRTDTKGA